MPIIFGSWSSDGMIGRSCKKWNISNNFNKLQRKKTKKSEERSEGIFRKHLNSVGGEQQSNTEKVEPVKKYERIASSLRGQESKMLQ